MSSGGGHWDELLRAAPAFAECEVVYVTVHAMYHRQVGEAKFYAVRDITRWNKVRWAQTLLQLLWILLKERPDVVFSTGALPGFFAVRLGKLLGARTIWLDSLANVEELSMSGQKVGRYADLWLTQWPHLARPEGPRCEGSVL